MKNLKEIICLLAVALTLSLTVEAQLSYQVGSPTEVSGSINAGDVQQTGRVTRDGSPSTCINGPAPLQENNTALRRDAHNFVNPYNETVCVRVRMDFAGCSGNQTQSTAYSSYNPALPAANVIGDSGYSTINKGSYLFSVAPNAQFTVVVNEIEQNTGCPLYKLNISYLRNCRNAGFDYTNDGMADPTVYNVGAISTWRTFDSESQQVVTRSFGTVGDVVTGGSDYTGDGRSDLSVFRPSAGVWYYSTDQQNPGTGFNAVQFGLSGDRAAPGDYDGDGISDVALWRNTDGNFYVMRSSDSTFQGYHWGINNDRLTVGDFDGDAVSDFVVVRPTAGGLEWYIQKSNYNYGFTQGFNWGLSAGDTIVPADYDGDTVTDAAVWRQSEGNFYVRRSSDGSMQVFKWGISGDLPQPADYDGDGKADFAVYRGSNNTWYIYNSATDTMNIKQLGATGGIPITAPYRVQ